MRGREITINRYVPFFVPCKEKGETMIRGPP